MWVRIKRRRVLVRTRNISFFFFLFFGYIVWRKVVLNGYYSYGRGVWGLVIDDLGIVQVTWFICRLGNPRLLVSLSDLHKSWRVG